MHDDDDDDDGVAQHGGHTPNNRLTETYSLGFSCTSLISGHPCHDQLTPVKTTYPLTSITGPYRGLKFTAHRVHMLL